MFFGYQVTVTFKVTVTCYSLKILTCLLGSFP